MICCILSALFAGNLAVAGRLARRALPVAAMLAVAGSVMLAPAAASHAGHYVARAEANHRSLLEELLAQPLCSGEASTLTPKVTP